MFEMNRIIAAASVCLLATACGASSIEGEIADDSTIAFSEDELSLQNGAMFGAVFTMTNDPGGNGIAVHDRMPSGELVYRGTFPTAGLGTGQGLGSQGAVILAGQHILAVNPGSNSLSLMRVRHGNLDLVDVIDSGGVHPNSVTVRGNLVYVLNSGGDGNISGFRVEQGRFVPVPASTRRLSSIGGSAAAQVEFHPSGQFLVVTERMTNVLSTYDVLQDGTTIGPIVTTSSGETPFGFAFTPSGKLIVSEAFGGRPNESAVSSYRTSLTQGIDLVTPSLTAGETAACWVVVTPNGRYAYASNTASDSISSFRVGRLAELEIIQARVHSGEGARPLDMSMSRDGRYLYALNNGTDSIGVYVVADDGTLTLQSTVPGLVASSVGIASR